MSVKNFVKYAAVSVVTYLLWVSGNAAIAPADDQVQILQCPQSVRETIEREAFGGRIQEIERATFGGEMSYEAEVILDGEQYEGKVRADGLLVRKALQFTDDDETDDDDSDENDSDARDA